eukprot:scaffold27680_cov33-Tisochrysis_lutea.AAC.3
MMPATRDRALALLLQLTITITITPALPPPDDDSDSWAPLPLEPLHKPRGGHGGSPNAYRAAPCVGRGLEGVRTKGAGRVAPARSLASWL